MTTELNPYPSLPDSDRIVSNGFGGAVARVETTFLIWTNGRRTRLYAFAGVPARSDWYTARNAIAEGTESQMKDALDCIVGVAGAHKAFRHVYFAD